VRDFAGFDSDYIRNWVYPEDRELLTGISDAEYIRKKLSGERIFCINYRIVKGGKPTYMQLRVVDVGKEESVSQVVFGYRNTDSEVRREMNQKQLLVETLHEANLANNAKNLFLSNVPRHQDAYERDYGLYCPCAEESGQQGKSRGIPGYDNGIRGAASSSAE
jgi:hypothetical protein